VDEEDEHSPSEFYYPEDLEIFYGETETGFTECHVINNLLSELARAILGNISLYCQDLSPLFPSTALVFS